MQYITVMNLVITTFMSLVWSSKSWLNLLVKFAFICAMVFNAVAVFQQFGYIVKI